MHLVRHDARHGLLEDATRSNTLEELGGSFAAIRDPEWVWLDVWIGVMFKVGEAPAAWDAVSLVARVLTPCCHWFR